MLIAGALGLGAFWRRGRRRSALALSEPDPAAELRERLAQAKVADDPPAELALADGEPEPTRAASTEAPDAPALDPVTRRRSIHERARDSIDELR
jgi:hypothetical protein